MFIPFSKFLRFSWLLLISIAVFNSVLFATTYYSQGNVFANLPTNWNTNPLGGGTIPNNFSSGDIFIIQPNHGMNLDAAWNVGGVGSEIRVQGALNLLNNSFNLVNTKLIVTGILDCGNTIVNGNGDVIISAGAVLGIGRADGISAISTTGNIQVTGARSFSDSASYRYNGIIVQITGDGLPSTVDSLNILNSNGVTLTNSLTVNGTITLLAGKFSIDGNNLTLNGKVSTIGTGYFFLQNNGTVSYNSTVDSQFVIGRNSQYGNLFFNNFLKKIDIGTISISGMFTKGNVANSFPVNSSTIFNGPSGQTIPSLSYNSLSITGYRGGATVVFDHSSPFKIKDSLNFSASFVTGGNYISDSSRFELYDSADVTGIFTFYDLYVFGKVTLPSGLVVSHYLKLLTNSSLSGFPPTYLSGSTLIYYNSGIFSRGLEWSSLIGEGYPYNVVIGNNTEVNLGANSGTTTARQIAGNLTIESSSELNMNRPGSVMTASLTVNGNVNINASGIVNLSSLSGGNLFVNGNFTNNGIFAPNNSTVNFNGSTKQFISGAFSFYSLVVNNSGGIDIANVDTVISSLILTNGKIYTNNQRLVLTSSATVSRSNGYVEGNLEWLFPIGTNVSRTFPIGNTFYDPVDISFPSISSAGSIVASTSTSTESLLSSGFDTTKNVNRYWNIVGSAFSFSPYTVTLHYDSTEKDFGADPNKFYIKVTNVATWYPRPVINLRTQTSTQAIGVVNFGSFFVGELTTHAITPNVYGSGTISPGGVMNVKNGDSLTLTIVPNAGYHFDSLYIDGAKFDSTTSYTFIAVSASHTIDAYFSSNNLKPYFTTSFPDTFFVNENQNFTFDVNGADPEGGFVRFMMNSSPSGMTIDSITGIITWKPTFTQSGIYSFQILVKDSSNLDSMRVQYSKVTNVNRYPSFISVFPDTFFVNENQLFTYDANANDPDGDSLRFYFIGGPIGMNIDTLSGIVNWIPTYVQSGIYSFGLRVRDIAGLDTVRAILLRVFNVNRPPTFSFVLPDTLIAKYDTLVFTFTANDLDNDSIKYFLQNAPISSTIDSIGTLKWIADSAVGNYNFVIRIFDGIANNFDTARVRVIRYGDVTGNGTISSLDASFVLRRVVNDTTLSWSPLQEKIADVTGSAGVSAFDASYILRFVTGNVFSFPNGLGKEQMLEKTASSFSFRFEKRIKEREFDLVVRLESELPAYAVNFSFGYDTSLISPLMVKREVLADTMSITYNFLNGKANVALAGTQPLHEKGDIARFSFTLKEPHDVHGKVVFSVLKFIINETDVSADIGGIILDVKSISSQIPETFALGQNYPNPFNPSTTIQYQLPKASTVTITVYNMIGQVVKILVQSQQDAGYYNIVWNGKDSNDRTVASGVYIYKISADAGNRETFVRTKKMLFLK